MATTTSDLFPTRQSLLARLKDPEDQKSWYDFAAIYSDLIRSMAARSGLGEDETMEVVQETLISVSQSMPGFKYDPSVGTFKSWLFSIVKRRITDQFRKRKKSRQQRQSNHRASMEEGLFHSQTPSAENPMERMWDEEWLVKLREASIRNVKKRIDPKNFQIFDLHVNKEWDAKKVAECLQVSRARVYVVKHRLTRMIAREFQRLENELF